MRYIGYIIGAAKIIAGLANLLAWAKLGFKCPRYIHVLAGIGFFIGILLAWTTPATAPINDSWLLGKWWTAIYMSGFVYLAFGFYGGATVILQREAKSAVVNDSINLSENQR